MAKTGSTIMRRYDRILGVAPEKNNGNGKLRPRRWPFGIQASEIPRAPQSFPIVLDGRQLRPFRLYGHAAKLSPVLLLPRPATGCY